MVDFDQFGTRKNVQKDSSTVENRDKYKEQFFQLLKEDNFEDLKKLVNHNISWEAFTLNDNPNPKLMDNISFLANIIRKNNIEIVDYFINLPQYKISPNYLTAMSEHIAYGFEYSARGNDVKLLEYYENLHIQLGMDNLGQYCGLNTGRKFRDFDTETKSVVVVIKKYLFRTALTRAVQSQYPQADIIDFILAKKDKYGEQECSLVLNDMILQFNNTPPFYKKAQYIVESLGYAYEDRLFVDVYSQVKNNLKYDNLIDYLILEKNIPYTDSIKDVIKDDLKIQKIFLYRKLEGNLAAKETRDKPKI